MALTNKLNNSQNKFCAIKWLHVYLQSDSCKYTKWTQGETYFRQ